MGGVLFCFCSLFFALFATFLSGALFKNFCVSLFCALAFLFSLTLKPGDVFIEYLFGYQLVLYKVDVISLFILRGLLGIATMLVMCMYKFQAKALALCVLLTIATCAVIVSGDLISALITHELFALIGCVVVFSFYFHEDRVVVMHYIYFQVIASVMFVAGVAFRISMYGPEFAHGLPHNFSSDPGSYLIFASAAILCGLFPFSSWAVNVYHNMSTFPRLFLQSVNTITGLFSVLHMFQGVDFLLFLGGGTVLYCIMATLPECDVKKISAYNAIIQNGIILMYIGTIHAYETYIIAIQIVFCCIYQIVLVFCLKRIVDNSSTREIRRLGFGYTYVHFMLIGLILLHGGFPISTFTLTNFKSTIIQSAIGIIAFWAIHVRVFCYSAIFAKDRVNNTKHVNPFIFLPMCLLIFAVIVGTVKPGMFMSILFGESEYTYSISYRTLIYAVSLIPIGCVMAYFVPGVTYIRYNVEDYVYKGLFPHVYCLVSKFCIFVSSICVSKFSEIGNFLSLFLRKRLIFVKFSMIMFVGILLVGLCLTL